MPLHGSFNLGQHLKKISCIKLGIKRSEKCCHKLKRFIIILAWLVSHIWCCLISVESLYLFMFILNTCICLHLDIVIDVYDMLHWFFSKPTTIINAYFHDKGERLWQLIFIDTFSAFTTFDDYGLGIMFLTQLSTIFKLYHAWQSVNIYWWKKPKYPEKKPINLPQVTDP